jgi:hypothetical protein
MNMLLKSCSGVQCSDLLRKVISLTFKIIKKSREDDKNKGCTINWHFCSLFQERAHFVCSGCSYFHFINHISFCFSLALDFLDIILQVFHLS